MEKDENTISYHHKNVIEREWNSVVCSSAVKWRNSLACEISHDHFYTSAFLACAISVAKYSTL